MLVVILTEPVTSLSFTADSSLLLVSTLDSTHRLLDLQHGTVVQSFTGHKNTNYRSQSCFGAREETVICGDEDGKVFGWDMEAVSFPSACQGMQRSGGRCCRCAEVEQLFSRAVC